MAAPATTVRLPCNSPASAIRLPSKGRAMKPQQHRPNSTPIVALWVAAAKAVKTNSDDVSRVEIFSPCSTRMNSDSTASPAKMSVNSMLASHGSAVVRINNRPIVSSRKGWAMLSTRNVSCRTQSVAGA
jgi:hypothetical protein